jgi:hypothetical protein
MRRFFLYVRACVSASLLAVAILLVVAGLASREGSPGLCVGMRRIDMWDPQRIHVVLGINTEFGKIWYFKTVVPDGTGRRLVPE